MSKTAFPTFLPAMMAESAKTPFDAPDWIFEIKLDGYRAISVFASAGRPHLWSRNGLALEAKFPAVATAVSKLELRSTILDGEVVAVDEKGIPRFQLLQRFQKQLLKQIRDKPKCVIRWRNNAGSKRWDPLTKRKKSHA
jgi:ATP-dependent DNA ligase